jgi:hypothetical protein
MRHLSRFSPHSIYNTISCTLNNEVGSGEEECQRYGQLLVMLPQFVTFKPHKIKCRHDEDEDTLATLFQQLEPSCFLVCPIISSYSSSSFCKSRRILTLEFLPHIYSPQGLTFVPLPPQANLSPLFSLALYSAPVFNMFISKKENKFPKFIEQLDN